MIRRRWLRLWPAALLIVAGCSSSHKAAGSPQNTSTMAPSTTATTAVTQHATSTLAPTTTSTTVTAPGSSTVAAYPIVSAAGSLLQPPTAPVTIAAEQDCHQLLSYPLASIISCATATSPTGTITGTDEGLAMSEYWDVWKRDGNQADLALT